MLAEAEAPLGLASEDGQDQDTNYSNDDDSVDDSDGDSSDDYYDDCGDDWQAAWWQMIAESRLVLNARARRDLILLIDTILDIIW
jgi:hypothetical protein